MRIHSSTQSDIRIFREFWDSAINYQKGKGLPLWPSFPKNKIEEEIQAGLHFSATSHGSILAGFFSVALSDALIWGAQERGDAIYIHRMCVNPMCKGINLTSRVLAWAHGYTSSLGRKFIRMDTWANNKQLVNYYIGCGFHYIGDLQLDEVPELPSHYSHTRLALFQNAVDSLETLSQDELDG